MRRLGVSIACFTLVLACHRSDQKLQRGQQQYDVVQEGEATGTTTALGTTTITAGTSNIGTTDTNVDTTSNFNLPGAAPGSISAAPQSVAGSIATTTGARPRDLTPPMTSGNLPPETTGTSVEPRRRLPRPSSPPPARTDTTGSAEPVLTDTTATSTAASTTSTSTSTTTSTSPPPRPPTGTRGSEGQSVTPNRPGDSSA
jgi:hypothetical protein